MNASVLTDAFSKKGYKIISGGTDNHSMLIDLRTKLPDLTGKQAQISLGKAEITINKNMVPFDSRSPFLTSGFRVGTPAITSRGIKESEILTIVDLIDEVLVNAENDTIISKVKSNVHDLVKSYPLFQM